MTEASDIPKGNWIDRAAPAPARPYLRLMRLDRPIGTWLLLIPCWWGAALAADRGPWGGWPDPWLMVLFAVGAVAMRGAGCTFNDIVDREIDRRVARTADRPVASGAVSVFAAVLFMGAQMLVGLAVLLLLNRAAIGLGLLSLALVALYPFMKRLIWWPQAVLGLAFNWGALLGYVAVAGKLEQPALWLYAAGFVWTLGYDTIYAHQDKEDDALIGVKSSALWLGELLTQPFLGLTYMAAVLFLAIAGAKAGLGWPFHAGLALAALHLLWQAWKVETDDPQDCLRKFRSNRDLGLLIFAAIVAGRLAG
jgi:4-hydroxybenzoate polyprenyltransferase